MEVVGAGWVEGYFWKVGVWIYRDASFRTILPQVAVAVGVGVPEETVAAGSAVVFSATEALSRCVNAPCPATRLMGERVLDLIGEVRAGKAAAAQSFF